MEECDPRPPASGPGNLIGHTDSAAGISDEKHSLNKTRGGLAMGGRHAKQVCNPQGRVVMAMRERDVVLADYPPGRLRISHGSPMRIANAADLF